MYYFISILSGVHYSQVTRLTDQLLCGELHKGTVALIVVLDTFMSTTWVHDDLRVTTRNRAQITGFTIAPLVLSQVQRLKVNYGLSLSS